MTLTQSLDAGAPGIIAILRGVQPEAVLEIAAALQATLTERAPELVNAWLHATNQRDNN